MKVGVNKLLRAGMMPARTWGVHAVGMSATERFKLRRQVAGKECDFPVVSLWKHTASKYRGELSTMTTQYWAEGVSTGKWRHEQKEAWREANSRGSDVEPGERTRRSGDV